MKLTLLRRVVSEPGACVVIAPDFESFVILLDEGYLLFGITTNFQDHDWYVFVMLSLSYNPARNPEERRQNFPQSAMARTGDHPGDLQTLSNSCGGNGDTDYRGQFEFYRASVCTPQNWLNQFWRARILPGH